MKLRGGHFTRAGAQTGCADGSRTTPRQEEDCHQTFPSNGVCECVCVCVCVCLSFSVDMSL